MGQRSAHSIAHALLLGTLLAACSSSSPGSNTSGGADSVSADPGTNSPDGVIGVDLDSFGIAFATGLVTDYVASEFTLTVDVIYGDPRGELVYTWDVGSAIINEGWGSSSVVIQYLEGGLHSVTVGAQAPDGRTASVTTFLLVLESGERPVVGDLDRDGLLTESDITLLGAFVTGTGNLELHAWERADIDLNEAVDGVDLGLLQQAVDDGDAAPTYMQPQEGSPGTLVMLIHPGLLEPGASFELEAENDSEIELILLYPGYAQFYVPFNADASTTLELRLLRNDEQLDRFSFEVSELPMPSENPGATLLHQFELLDQIAIQLPRALYDSFETAGLAQEGLDVLTELFALVDETTSSLSLELQAALATATPEQLAALEQLALANGLEESILALEQSLDDLTVLSQKRGDWERATSFAESLCTIQEITSNVETAGKINDAVFSVLGNPVVALIPGVGPTLAAIAGTLGSLKPMFDLLGVVAKILPKMDRLDVAIAADDQSERRTQDQLEISEMVTLDAIIEIRPIEGVCYEVAMGGRTGIEGVSDDSARGAERLKVLFRRLIIRGMVKVLSRVPSNTVRLFLVRFGAAGYDPDVLAEQGANPIELGLLHLLKKVSDYIFDTAFGPKLEKFARWLCEGVTPEAASWDLSFEPQKVLGASCGNIVADQWMCTRECAGETVRITMDPEFRMCGDLLYTNAVDVGCNVCDSSNCEGCCERAADDVLACLDTSGARSNVCGSNGGPCYSCSAGFSVVADEPLVVGETGTRAHRGADFTIGLQYRPRADVTITLGSSDETQGWVEPESITFTLEEWDRLHTVTLIAANDGEIDGDQGYFIYFDPAVSDDSGYDGLVVPQVLAITLDNVIIDVDPLDLTITEGESGTFEVVLLAEPTATVVVPLESSDESEGLVSPERLLFSVSDWDTPRPVTVTGVEDEVADGNRPFTAITGALVSDDDVFSGVNPPDVSVNNIDSGSDICEPCADAHGDRQLDDEGNPLECLICQGEVYCVKEGTHECCATEAFMPVWPDGTEASCCSHTRRGRDDGHLICYDDAVCAQCPSHTEEGKMDTFCMDPDPEPDSIQPEVDLGGDIVCCGDFPMYSQGETCCGQQYDDSVEPGPQAGTTYLRCNSDVTYCAQCDANELDPTRLVWCKSPVAEENSLAWLDECNYPARCCRSDLQGTDQCGTDQESYCYDRYHRDPDSVIDGPNEGDSDSLGQCMPQLDLENRECWIDRDCEHNPTFWLESLGGFGDPPNPQYTCEGEIGCENCLEACEYELPGRCVFDDERFDRREFICSRLTACDSICRCGTWEQPDLICRNGFASPVVDVFDCVERANDCEALETCLE